jgi:hypothetical protein
MHSEEASGGLLRAPAARSDGASAVSFVVSDGLYVIRSVAIAQEAS